MAEQKQRKNTCHAQFSDILFPFLKTKESVKITKEIMCLLLLTLFKNQEDHNSLYDFSCIHIIFTLDIYEKYKQGHFFKLFPLNFPAQSEVYIILIALEIANHG